ncbi:MAG: Holliday junction branch migration protein RuvA, partial [Oscillospiraceae bacterium]|nr:Holliday junction branch migration protein RuvA [Oscillospiraceae bacterium]
KDKIVKENNIDFSAASGGPAVPVSDGSAVSEAFSALLVLGYTQSEIAPVLAGLDQTLPSAELIRQALKIMAQRMNL